MVPAIVVADTSVLINFLRINRMDLIGAHPASFIATDHVAAEITGTFPNQQARYAAALHAAQLTQVRVDDPAELEIFLRLAARGRLELKGDSMRKIGAQRDRLDATRKA
jgi:hypothetical protein